MTSLCRATAVLVALRLPADFAYPPQGLLGPGIQLRHTIFMTGFALRVLAP